MNISSRVLFKELKASQDFLLSPRMSLAKLISGAVQLFQEYFHFTSRWQSLFTSPLSLAGKKKKKRKKRKQEIEKEMEMKTDKDRFLNSAHCVYFSFMNGFF